MTDVIKLNWTILYFLLTSLSLLFSPSLYNFIYIHLHLNLLFKYNKQTLFVWIGSDEEVSCKQIGSKSSGNNAWTIEHKCSKALGLSRSAKWFLGLQLRVLVTAIISFIIDSIIMLMIAFPFIEVGQVTYSKCFFADACLG